MPDRRILSQLILVAVVMLVLMTAYEFLKQVFLPDISIWGSHVVTILFTTLLATATFYFVLEKQQAEYSQRLREISKRRASEAALKESQAKWLSRKRVEAEKDKLYQDLKASLDQVRTLHGMIPICSSCKKIRDDKGYWEQIEKYIMTHSEAQFSHSLCPECIKELYPKFSAPHRSSE